MEYKIIKEFKSNGKDMVIVRSENAAHVMTVKECRKIYRNLTSVLRNDSTSDK